MTALLIKKEDFHHYFHIAKGRSTSEFEQYIKEAQVFDLKPLLCESFYNFLLHNTHQTRVINLLNGFTYLHQKQMTSFEGLNSSLAQFTYARYIYKSNLVDTSFGFVQKIDENSLPLNSKEKEKLHSHYRHQGFLLFEEFKKHILRNLIQYPEFLPCKSPPENNKLYLSKVVNIN